MRALSPTETSPATCTEPSMRPRISRSPSPRMLPRTRVPRPMVFAAATLHVHVDVALEGGAVCDGESRRLHVADELAAREQIHALARVHVARHAAAHREL